VKLKKGKYRFVRIMKVSSSQLYSLRKSPLDKLVKKYHLHDGNPWLFYNTPIYLFAKDYVANKKGFKNRAMKAPFVQYSMERYNVYTEQYKNNLIQRVISIVKSIKKHRYAKGKYRNKLICVIKRKDGGYELISGKHRAAACLALGMDAIKCNLYKKVK